MMLYTLLSFASVTSAGYHWGHVESDPFYLLVEAVDSPLATQTYITITSNSSLDLTFKADGDMVGRPAPYQPNLSIFTLGSYDGTLNFYAPDRRDYDGRSTTFIKGTNKGDLWPLHFGYFDVFRDGYEIMNHFSFDESTNEMIVRGNRTLLACESDEEWPIVYHMDNTKEVPKGCWKVRITKKEDKSIECEFCERQKHFTYTNEIAIVGESH